MKGEGKISQLECSPSRVPWLQQGVFGRVSVSSSPRSFEVGRRCGRAHVEQLPLQSLGVDRGLRRELLLPLLLLGSLCLGLRLRHRLRLRLLGVDLGLLGLGLCLGLGLGLGVRLLLRLLGLGLLYVLPHQSLLQAGSVDNSLEPTLSLLLSLLHLLALRLLLLGLLRFLLRCEELLLEGSGVQRLQRLLLLLLRVLPQDVLLGDARLHTLLGRALRDVHEVHELGCRACLRLRRRGRARHVPLLVIAGERRVDVVLGRVRRTHLLGPLPHRDGGKRAALPLYFLRKLLPEVLLHLGVFVLLFAVCTALAAAVAAAAVSVVTAPVLAVAPLRLLVAAVLVMVVSFAALGPAVFLHRFASRHSLLDAGHGREGLRRRLERARGHERLLGGGERLCRRRRSSDRGCGGGGGGGGCGGGGSGGSFGLGGRR
eukprot:Rhum_TRINITY_DN14689_c2_g1::Rhum_TRINITY_DN14689_c2_g1_i1::g.109797::m.109797